ncbi:AraC family transcriptional regulator [Pseudoxanthomonas indica]|uniref:Transcriptional regulator, AraC family n=1 Tax=Pseudoxanthomonas indica TaxID=428993 RepID=A0A1T5LPW1_9GAMM|nr:AraC family transcriptional regulator [Pseudoxanthomonas indica]GGD37470.1 AraC family transcriptional regulator [Pseudoxanthomonas indica]SKC77599.1 transcriptional regulator, AraC family [Pseudoxanthomonas indica]
MGAMQGVPEQFEATQDNAEFRHPAHRPGVELYRAHIVRHSFEPHAHEAYGLGAIESGAERFRYAGSEQYAGAGSLLLMNPEALHTGRAETEEGWRYRMIYLDREVLEQVTGDAGWSFDQAVRHDAARAAQVGQRLQALWYCDTPLAFDSLLAELIDLVRPDARVARQARQEARPRFSEVTDFLRANLDRSLRLDDLAQVAGLSPFHFLRQFRAQHHVTPQQMLMAYRMHDAKRRQAAGEAAAQVAAATGMVDQAHLTHSFARRYGVTPGRYQRQVRG